MSPQSMAELGFKDSQIYRVFNYWLSKRGRRRFPARADIDPADLRFVLGDVVLLDVAHHPLRFSFRLVGTRIAQHDGYDMTGKSLDLLPDPEYREAIRRTVTQVCERAAPILGSRDQLIDHRVRAYEFLILPLASNGCDIDMLFSVQRHVPSALAAAGIDQEPQIRALQV